MVLAGVGGVTLSDVAVAHASGARAVHTFNVPRPVPGPNKATAKGRKPRPQKAQKSGGAALSVVEEAKRRGIALLAFETIQDLLDDLLPPNSPTDTDSSVLK